MHAVSTQRAPQKAALLRNRDVLPNKSDKLKQHRGVRGGVYLWRAVGLAETESFRENS